MYISFLVTANSSNYFLLFFEDTSSKNSIVSLVEFSLVATDSNSITKKGAISYLCRSHTSKLTR